MGATIWHVPPQTPDVFRSYPIIVIYEAGDQIEQMDSKEYSDKVGERYVNRWCYTDDLIKALDFVENVITKLYMAGGIDDDILERIKEEYKKDNK